MKVSCSPLISGVYQPTAILPSPGVGFLSHYHSWARNHPWVPNLLGCLSSVSLRRVGRGSALQNTHGSFLSPLRSCWP